MAKGGGGGGIGGVIRQLAVGSSGGALLNDVGLLVARVGFGACMAIGHGLAKIKNPGAMAGYLEGMGMPAPTAMAWVAGVVEFFGAIFLTIGLVTRPAAALLAGTMSVAVFLAHKKDPLFAPPLQNSAERAVLYLIVFVLFVLAGGGRFSLDAFLRRKS